ncbi:MAG: hypothetical protein WA209_21490 [Candidatus Acidiferrales bacterium]
MSSSINSKSATPERLPGRWSIAIFWAGLWAPLVVLAINLSDRSSTGHVAPWKDIFVHLTIFVGMGFLLGLGLRSYQEWRSTRPPSRSPLATRHVLFVSLLVALAYFLWRMVGKP